MKQIARYSLPALGLLAVTVIIGTSSSARAAVRAAFVQVIDEPGRNPYQTNREFAYNFQGSDYQCVQSGPPECNLFFPGVPAGKRLVIENVTGAISVLSPAFPRPLNLQAAGAHLALVPMFLMAGIESGFLGNQLVYVVNAQVKHYVEGGQSPVISVSMVGNPGDLLNGSIAISGYLVELTQ